MNELNQFNVGGSHESNPYSGIPLGTDQNGVPNTVEENETMFDDFVFSDRIVLRPDVVSQVGLPKTLANKTVAEATKIIDKQFDGRNTKIDKSTRDAMYDRIAQAQEIIKAEEQAKIAQALEANSTEVPDMIGGEIPQGMDQFMQPEQGMEQLPMEAQDGRVQSGMQDLGQPVFKYGGKTNRFDDGGDITPSFNPGFDMGTDSGIHRSNPNLFQNLKFAIQDNPNIVGGAIGAAAGIPDVVNTLKGENVSTNSGTAAISGITKGASMGSIAGPLGAAAGAVVGGVSGLIGSNKARKKAEKAAREKEMKDYYDKYIGVLDNNDNTQVFAYGGKVNKYVGGGSTDPYKFDPNNIDHVKGLQSWGNTNKTGWLNNNPNPKYKGLNGILPENHPDYGIYGMATQTLPVSEYEAYMNSLQNQNNTPSSYDPSQDVILQNMNKYNGQSEAPMGPLNYNQDPVTGGTHFGRKKSIQPGVGYGGNNTNNAIETKENSQRNSNLGSLLRYAPAAMNAYQLATLKGPQTNRLQRLNNQYQRQFLDEATYQNIAREQAAATRSAIGRSGATPGQMIGAQLGTQLGASKAIADSYNQIRQHNIGENRMRQQTQFGNNQFNIQQDNLEQDINDRNKAAWQNNRSRLLSQLGNDLGGIGREEVYKDMAVEATGYDWMGKYMQGNPNATKEEATKAYKKANPNATQKEIDEAYNKAKKNSSYKARSSQEQEDYLKWIIDNNLQHQYKDGAIDYSRYDEYKRKNNSNRLGGILNRKLR